MNFYIKQKVFSFKDKFKVMDESQNEVYQIKGKFMSMSNKLSLLDMNDNVVLNANKKILALLPKYFIYSPDGNELAVIKKKFSIRPKFEITSDFGDLYLEGSLFAHSFTVERDGKVMASISKNVLSFGDTYEIDVEDENNVEFYLFLVIVIDQVLHEQKKKSALNF